VIGDRCAGIGDRVSGLVFPIADCRYTATDNQKEDWRFSRHSAMNMRKLLPFVCLGLVLLTACAPTATPMGPPTSVPRTDVVSTPGENPLGPPVVTIQGELEGGVPFGVTDDGYYFKGDPNAPVVLYEFSDYQ
jgi:hypothetical protein